tara:strand:+ start:125644 stop:126573 length:930 start_codon:yes stop_codon:yes gene_type:complete
MQKLLLAVDGSQASEEAARLIARLPHPERLEVTVLSVVPHPVFHGGSSRVDLLEKAFERDNELAAETFRKIEDMFDGANVTLVHQIRNGNIGQAIVDAAIETHADLVVLGAVGRSDISRVLLGSVSDHVATHAPCSVLVVRPTGLVGTDKPIRVCLAFEGSGPAQAALEEISEIPWHSGTDFHVLSVASYLYDFFGELHKDSETAQRYTNDLKSAKEQLDEVASTVQTHLIESEHIGEGIVNFASKNDVDLLVIGETNRNALTRFLLGSTSRYVLRHAPCSVWISRNRIVKGVKKTGEHREAISEPQNS